MLMGGKIFTIYILFRRFQRQYQLSPKKKHIKKYFTMVKFSSSATKEHITCKVSK